mgnify:CR=1 FL=1
MRIIERWRWYSTSYRGNAPYDRRYVPVPYCAAFPSRWFHGNRIQRHAQWQWLRRHSHIEIAIQLQAERSNLFAFHRNGESAMVGGFRPCGHIRGRCFARSERGDGNIGDCSILTNKIGVCACRAENQGTTILYDLTFAVEVILECRMLDGADMVRADIEERGDVESKSEKHDRLCTPATKLHN